jgi:hypothetical protein
MIMNDKNLGEALSEVVTEHGLTLEKLSEITNIPKRYLLAMTENDVKNMPAAPYIRGYISKICSMLDADPAILHAAYKKTELKTSGREDYLPKNRFAIVKKSKKKFWIISFITIGFIIAGLRIGPALNSRNAGDIGYAFLGIPSIEVNLPAKVNDQDFSETRERTITIDGKINPRDSIIINRELVSVNNDGLFSKEAFLNTGLNVFEIKVKRFLGREITVIRKVFYITEEKNEEKNNINGEEIIQEG